MLDGYQVKFATKSEDGFSFDVTGLVMTMRTSLRRWLAGACVVAALSLVGCSSGDPKTTETTSSGARPSSAEAPSDRDEAAVLAALRQLDFCAVLTAAQPASAAKPVASEPFSCGIEGGSVGVVQMGFDSRLKLPMRAFGGAKAYVDFSKSDRCQVDLPISFELVLEFDVDRTGAGCGRHVDEFVAAAVEALGDPATVSADAKWDACSALDEALGDAETDALIPASAFVGGACERWEPSLAQLDFGYTNPIIGDSRTATVGGVPVAVQEDDSTGQNACWMAWRSGPTDQWVGVAAAGCAETKTLAASVMKVLATAPPRVEPQQPLLYGADEPDSPFRGACAHLEPNLAKRCAPFEEVPVPEGKDAILRAAEADADVHCAVARDAIAEHFGARLVPVTIDDGDCYFVEPERQVQIRFQLASDSIGGVPDVFKVHDARIAGHPGYIADGQRAYEVWVAMSDDPGENGSVELSVDGGPASRNAGPPDDAKTKVDRTINDILRRYTS